MSVNVNVHFEGGVHTFRQYLDVANDVAAIDLQVDLQEQGDVSICALYFGRPEDIDTLVAALVKLRDDFAAARPADPAVVPLFEPKPTEPKTEDMPIRLEMEPVTAFAKCQGCMNLLQTTIEIEAGFCEECQAEHKKIAF